MLGRAGAPGKAVAPAGKTEGSVLVRNVLPSA